MTGEDVLRPKAKPFVDRQASNRAPGQIGVAIEKRREGQQCPWPMWEFPAKSGEVCGLPSDPKAREDWCTHHRALVYVKPEPR